MRQLECILPLTLCHGLYYYIVVSYEHNKTVMYQKFYPTVFHIVVPADITKLLDSCATQAASHNVAINVEDMIFDLR